VTIPIYLINLDRSPERLEHMRTQLARFGLPYERLAAVDGSRADAEVLRHARATAGCRPLRPGEIGCFASHYAIWRGMVEQGTPRVLVLEDDIVIDDSFAAAVEAVASTDLDFVRLSKLRPATGPALCRLGAFEVIEDFSFPKLSGTGAYVIGLEGARRLLAHAEVWNLPVDDYMDLAWLHGVRTLELSPLPVAHTQDFGSETLVPARTHAPRGRTAVQRHRLGREIRRAFVWMRWSWHMATVVLPDHAMRRLRVAPPALPAPASREA